MGEEREGRVVGRGSVMRLRALSGNGGKGTEETGGGGVEEADDIGEGGSERG